MFKNKTGMVVFVLLLCILGMLYIGIGEPFGIERVSDNDKNSYVVGKEFENPTEVTQEEVSEPETAVLPEAVSGSETSPLPEIVSEPESLSTSETVPEAEYSSLHETTQIPAEVSDDSDLVKVTDYLPQISVDLKYSTDDNFTGQVIYEFQDVYLRYGTVEKLVQVCEELAEHGLSIKIWDGFRPAAAQFKLWEVCPDANYVANPNVKFSSHSRGNTVDVTLVNLQGNDVEMPTGFDDFSVLADRDYSDCSVTAAKNAVLLQKIMEKHGFTGYFKEWWHYSDCIEYPVEKNFDPAEEK